MPDKLTAFVEISSLLAIVAVACLLVATGVLPESGCIWLSTILLCAIVWLSWYRFDGGRHPCFLFMVMLFVFQGGRLAGYVVGAKKDPMYIDVQTRFPISVESRYAEITLLIIVLSAILVYAPCRLSYRPVSLRQANAGRWLPALYSLVLLTLPFSLYKNLMYLWYIRTHGGYLVVYTDNADVLQSAGVLARTLSMVNITAILVLFVVETRRRHVMGVLALFGALSFLDLLIGFRGKFFSTILSLWFLMNLKTGRRFRLPMLVTSAVLISASAVIVGFFREDNAFEMVSPIGFLVMQGVSMNVTEAAVKFYSTFSPYGWEYLWGGFVNGLTPTAAAGLHLWSGDLSVYLNPISSNMGFGTASSYLAELYLFGGTSAVAAGSLLIGFCLGFLHRLSSRRIGVLLMAFILPPVIYLPRLEMFNPLAVLLKSCVGISAVIAFALAFDLCARFLKVLSGPSDSSADWEKRKGNAVED
ncbi:MAG: O-antigen polysaccharide polymerase Wzy [Acidobacteria bacterium]|nr:O-antigen polysaccharide polymerase Wzy [Acidobacteriota bacterium]